MFEQVDPGIGVFVIQPDLRFHHNVDALVVFPIINGNDANDLSQRLATMSGVSGVEIMVLPSGITLHPQIAG